MFQTTGLVESNSPTMIRKGQITLKYIADRLGISPSTDRAELSTSGVDAGVGASFRVARRRGTILPSPLAPCAAVDSRSADPFMISLRLLAVVAAE